MKKILLLGLMLMIGLCSYSQTNFKLGVHGGIPTGDIADVTSFEAGGEVAYLIDFLGLLEAGALVGYSQYTGEEGFDDVQFVPVAASARLGLPQTFFVGMDLGYAFGLSDGMDGGFYYRPQIGYQLLKLALVLSYSGISDDNYDVSSINLGVELYL